MVSEREKLETKIVVLEERRAKADAETLRAELDRRIEPLYGQLIALDEPQLPTFFKRAAWA